jgi:hypothetical protein
MNHRHKWIFRHRTSKQFEAFCKSCAQKALLIPEEILWLPQNSLVSEIHHEKKIHVHVPHTLISDNEQDTRKKQLLKGMEEKNLFNSFSFSKGCL